MAKFKVDQRDIEFNLFDMLKIEEHIEGFEVNDLKDIITQFSKFVESEVFPTRTDGDEIGVKLTADGVVIPESFKKSLEQYYANGWFALGYSEDVGGMGAPSGLSYTASSIYVGANTALSLYPALSSGALNAILEIGTDEQKASFTQPMIEGTWGGTMCLTEPGAGSDVGAVKTTAKPIGDGGYKINGVKIFISSGDNDYYKNIIHLVLARTPGAPEGTKGLSLFIVPKYKINDDNSLGEANNVKCTKIEEKMGIHGSATCELTFGGEGDCVGHLIGKEFDGMQNMFIMMNEARLLCGIQGESQANLAYELTKQYAYERAQFGSELVNLPDVKRMLLKMRALSRGMRALVLYTGNLFDLEKKGIEGAADEVAFLTPICKAYCSDEGFNVAVDAIQVHGGYGFCSEYGIEQFARDAKIATIYEGTNGIQAIDFVLRKTLKDGGKTFASVGAKIQKSLSSDEAKNWPQECAMLGKNMVKAQEVLEKYGEWAKSDQINSILESATDFLTYCGNLIVAWRLLESACVAKKSLDAASGEEKVFLLSKIDDFKIFCQHCLTRNTGISQGILNFDPGLSKIEI